MAKAHSIDISEHEGVRYLHFGSEWVQGAMRIARPWSLELAYTRDMLFGLLLRPPEAWPKEILLIGLGTGSLAKFLYRALPGATLTIFEIDARIPFIAEQYFKLPNDPRRLRIQIGDGADLLANDNKMYDAILVDGFDHKAKAGTLETLPFYQLCRAHLNDTGWMACNQFGQHRHFARNLAAIEQAFSGETLILPPTASGNIAVSAYAQRLDCPDRETLLASAKNLHLTHKLNLIKTLEAWLCARD